MVSQVKFKLLSLAKNEEGEHIVELKNTETGNVSKMKAGGLDTYPHSHACLVIYSNFCLNTEEKAMEVIHDFILNSLVKHANEGCWTVTINKFICVDISVDPEYTFMDIIENIAIHGLEFVANNIVNIPNSAYTCRGDTTGSEISVTLFERYGLTMIENANENITSTQFMNALLKTSKMIMMVEGCFRNAISVGGINHIQIISNSLQTPTVLLFKTNASEELLPIETIPNLVTIDGLAYKLIGTNASVIASVAVF